MPDVLIFGLGLWALGAIAGAPFAFKFDPGDPKWDEGPRHYVDWDQLATTLIWPLVPVFLLLFALVVLPSLFLVFRVPEYLERWWQSEWFYGRARR